MRTSEPTADLIIKFDRIGRTGSTPEAALTLHVPANIATDADKVADVVHRHCQHHLGSRDFKVIVDLGDGSLSIEYGRFGKGRILRATDARPKLSEGEAAR